MVEYFELSVMSVPHLIIDKLVVIPCCIHVSYVQVLMRCTVFASSYGPNFRPSFSFISQAISAFKLQLLYK